MQQYISDDSYINTYESMVEFKVTYKEAIKLHNEEDRGTYSAMMEVNPKT